MTSTLTSSTSNAALCTNTLCIPRADAKSISTVIVWANGRSKIGTRRDLTNEKARHTACGECLCCRLELQRNTAQRKRSLANKADNAKRCTIARYTNVRTINVQLYPIYIHTFFYLLY
mmetsp:Transcript_2021/g.7540  ORF Transcript_2021/g.7540 Transcript_2021/m.7540 type:complete len:118 (+) Transcript_2021:1645-1998(+)